MNETTLSTEPPPVGGPPDPRPSHAPAALLMNLIIAFLTPMFLSVSGGSIALARMAAAETVDAYRARSQTDLIAIAQIIACGLTALGSLSLSMADDLSLSMVLRLRGNAVSLNRAAEQNRRTLGQAGTGRSMPPHAAATDLPAMPVAHDPGDVFSPAPPSPGSPSAPLPTTGGEPLPPSPPNRRPFTAPDPVPAASSSAPAPAARPAITDQQRLAIWAAGMTKVAAELAGDLQNLPPKERKLASIRAASLNSSASRLLLGNLPPPLGLDDLAAIMNPSRSTGHSKALAELIHPGNRVMPPTG
jgi:hypothetical protein